MGTFLENVAAYGSLPVGPDETYPLAVSYDPAHIPGTPGVACEGAATACRANFFDPPSFSLQGEEWIVEAHGQAGARTVTLVVVFDANESAPEHARAYYQVGADSAPAMPTCEHASTPAGVLTGNVILNQSPAASDTHGEASLVLPDDTEVVISF